MRPECVVGHATLHALSSTTDVYLRSQPLPMRESSLTGSFSVELPAVGKFKWKPNIWTMSSPELYDAADQKVAKLSSVGLTVRGQKKLEIMVPVADYFLDFVVLTAYAVRMNINSNREIASEVGQAIARLRG